MRINLYDLEMAYFGEPELIKISGRNYTLADPFLQNPRNITVMMNDIFHLNKKAEEFLYLITANIKNKPNGIHLLSKGTVDAALFSNRDIFVRVLLSGGKNIFVVHNHPSGDTTPSTADKDAANHIRKGAEILDLALTDFVIVGGGNSAYYSFYENGRL